MQKREYPSCFGASMWKLHLIWAGSMTSFCNMASMLFRIVALAVDLAQYSRCKHSWAPSWITMQCCALSICPNRPLHMEQGVDTIWQSACRRSGGKSSSLRVSCESFAVSSRLVEGSVGGNLDASFFSSTLSGPFSLCREPLVQSAYFL